MHAFIAQFGTSLLGQIAFIESAGSEPGILQQIGGLLLGAVPTMVLFIVLVVAYQLLVQKPLVATLAERRARTQGAMEESAKAIARAEARSTDYAEQLRLARQEVVKARDQRLKQWSAERDSALDAARKSAQAKVAQARAEVEAEAAVAKKAIEGSAGELAAKVVRAVLPATAGGLR